MGLQLTQTKNRARCTGTVYLLLGVSTMSSDYCIESCCVFGRLPNALRNGPWQGVGIHITEVTLHGLYECASQSVPLRVYVCMCVCWLVAKGMLKPAVAYIHLAKVKNKKISPESVSLII